MRDKLADLFGKKGSNPPSKAQAFISTTHPDDARKAREKLISMGADPENMRVLAVNPEDIGFVPKDGESMRECIQRQMATGEWKEPFRKKLLDELKVDPACIDDALKSAGDALEKQFGKNGGKLVDDFQVSNESALLGHKSLQDAANRMAEILKNKKDIPFDRARSVLSTAMQLKVTGKAVLHAALERSLQKDMSAAHAKVLVTKVEEIAKSFKKYARFSELLLMLMIGNHTEEIEIEDLLLRLSFLDAEIPSPMLPFRAVPVKAQFFIDHNWPLVKDGTMEFQDFHDGLEKTLDDERDAVHITGLDLECPCAECQLKAKL